MPIGEATSRQANLLPGNPPDSSDPESGKRPLPVVPIAAGAFGLFLIWRAWPRQGAAGPLGAASLGLGALAFAAGTLGTLVRTGSGELEGPLSRTKPWLGALIALAASAAASLDLLSGRSALVLVCGSVFLSLLYWDRPMYLFSLLGGGLAAAIATLVAGLRDGAAIREGASMAAVAVGLGAVIALTMRRVVAPGVERLRSLERENRELWVLSFRDGLTGLYNRRFAQETGRKLFARASRYQERLHVLMIDIDHFKRVNDKVSHAAGDEVLKDIATILQSCVRASDVVARYGGEEFVVFLIEAPPETAQFIANRIRDDVAAHRFEQVPWQVTISIGVAGLAGDESLEGLVDRADKHLYVAKRAGRNRVSGF